MASTNMTPKQETWFRTLNDGYAFVDDRYKVNGTCKWVGHVIPQDSWMAVGWDDNGKMSEGHDCIHDLKQEITERELVDALEEFSLDAVRFMAYHSNMTPITYTKGDATTPSAPGQKIIAHCCNDLGLWGAGFSGALSKRYPDTELLYRQWHRRDLSKPFRLGEVQFVKLSAGGDLWAANIIGQVGVRSSTNPHPIRYDALRSGLRKVFLEASVLSASVHMPRIGCGLAGGDWREVELIITHELAAKDIAVTVYDLE